MMNIKKVADMIEELAIHLDTNPFEIVDSLVGMVISEEDAGLLKEEIIY